MPVTVGVLFDEKYRSREKVCPCLCDGIARIGDKVEVRGVTAKLRKPVYTGVFSDALVFYGFGGRRDSVAFKAFEDYKRAGRPAIYIDLGYFNDKTRWGRYGFHRFSIDDRHPTNYFQKHRHKDDRFKIHNRMVAPWQTPGQNILVCGMSDKCARFEGFAFEQWERQAIATIKTFTNRNIIYRPKPRRRTEPQYPPIKGVGFSDPSRRSLHDELRDAWAVVSHHSNAGIDALLAGVPAFCDEGVALALGLSDLSLIETPRAPTISERKHWANDIAYCQFNRQEMQSGLFWRHFKNEGLVP